MFNQFGGLKAQRRSRDRHGVVEQRHDPTGQGVGLASDTELDEQRKAVVVDAFANEVGAIELEDQQTARRGGGRSAAGRERVPGGCRAGASQPSRGHRGDTVSRA